MNSKELTDEEFVDRLVEAGWKRWEAERELQDIAEECESGYENHETNTTMKTPEECHQIFAAQNYTIVELVKMVQADAVAQLTKERDQLAAKCERAEACCAFLKNHLKCIRDFDDDSPWDDPGYCAIDALKRSDQCGAGWLSPEKKKVLVEAAKLALDWFETGPADFSVAAEIVAPALEQALEGSK